MFTVHSLLDTVKDRRGIKSDYALAKVLDVTYHTLMNYRHGRSRPDDRTLSRLGELGEIDQVELDLLAVQLQAERCQNEDAKKLWMRIAKRLQGGGAMAGFLAALAVSLLVGAPSRAEASTLPSNLWASSESTVHYVKWLVDSVLRRLRKLVPGRPYVQGPKAHPQLAAAAG